jgi:hypothetical protein
MCAEYDDNVKVVAHCMDYILAKSASTLPGRYEVCAGLKTGLHALTASDKLPRRCVHLITDTNYLYNLCCYCFLLPLIATDLILIY